MVDLIDRWFIQSPARSFLKVTALFQTVSNDGFSDGLVLTNDLAQQVSSFLEFSVSFSTGMVLDAHHVRITHTSANRRHKAFVSYITLIVYSVLLAVH